MPCIKVKTGPNSGRVVEIGLHPVRIGRDDGMEIQVLDVGVSRHHAEVFRIGEMSFVRDINSTNGTLLNGVKASEEPLKDGDEILVGDTVLVFDDSAGR